MDRWKLSMQKRRSILSTRVLENFRTSVVQNLRTSGPQYLSDQSVREIRGTIFFQLVGKSVLAET